MKIDIRIININIQVGEVEKPTKWQKVIKTMKEAIKAILQIIDIFMGV
ncbi:MAG: hypothetical protein OXF42_04715 [Candidatus Dadabacteria bacterium]|nr:hypothetical protein [Candidatus Dadabacteria bacterium]